MMETPYTNEKHTCEGCGYPILTDWVADPDSARREDPDYYHISCFTIKELQNGVKPIQPKG